MQTFLLFAVKSFSPATRMYWSLFCLGWSGWKPVRLWKWGKLVSWWIWAKTSAFPAFDSYEPCTANTITRLEGTRLSGVLRHRHTIVSFWKHWLVNRKPNVSLIALFSLQKAWSWQQVLRTWGPSFLQSSSCGSMVGAKGSVSLRTM